MRDKYAKSTTSNVEKLLFSGKKAICFCNDTLEQQVHVQNGVQRSTSTGFCRSISALIIVILLTYELGTAWSLQGMQESAAM
jgi:hypothetical protein